MSFNGFLLSIFSKNRLFEANVNALSTHYQILSILYVGFSTTFAIVIFDFICCHFFGASCNYNLSMISISGFILAYSFLKKGYRDTAGTLVILYLHSKNLTTLMIINNIINVVEFFLYIKKILVIFQITLTDDQNIQILSAMVALAFFFIIMATLNYFQKNIECNLWRLLNENFKKSENLTKEVVQAMDAKDGFVSSLSHEVSSALNSLNGSVDYLFMVLKDSPHLQALKNAKMSEEILFNLVSNALDAAKLELCYSEANIEDVVKKAFVINSENFKCRNIFAKAFIDSRIPKNLWIDPGRNCKS